MTSQIAITTTFVATLLLPVASAVGLGVVLSLLLQLNQSALDLRLVEIVPRDDGRLEERPAPTRLASHTVTLIDVHGSLHYAGARTLQHHLPDPTGSDSPAVVLRMRGRTTVGATLFTVLAGYAEQLDAVGGRLYLAGLEPTLIAQAQRNGTVTDGGPGPPLRGERRDRRGQPRRVPRRASVGKHKTARHHTLRHLRPRRAGSLTSGTCRCVFARQSRNGEPFEHRLLAQTSTSIPSFGRQRFTSIV